MDLGRIAGTYIQRLVDGAGTKPRILLLDEETTGIVSLCTTQSLLLKHDIFLVDKLTNPSRQIMRHLDCICFVRPTSASVALLAQELRSPKYASYSLFFSNVVKKSQLERLAEADDHETVASVQEMYCDFYIINRTLFSLHLDHVNGPDASSWHPPALDRSVEGLVAAALSLKAKPLIRYEANSSMARRLAAEVSRNVQDQHQLFDFPKRDTPPILLILDRRNDPLTPLISHWTYQAMVDELVGVHNNLVSLKGAPGIDDEFQEIVLAEAHDAFFAEAMYLNFGDLGARVKDYVGQYQTKAQSNKQIQTVSDMKRFVEEYPEFRRLSGNVSKHVALVGELSRLVNAQELLAVSEVEQSIACTDNHNGDLKRIQELVASAQVTQLAKYRLVALYALRYRLNPHNSTAMLLELIETAGYGNAALKTAVQVLVKTYSNDEFRLEDILGTHSLLSRAQLGLRGLKGVENVYTQHKPLLEQTLTALSRGKLKKQKYPFFNPGDRSLPSWALQGEETDMPQEVIVFVIGGVTYEEARVVAELNEGGVRYTIGGTCTTNSRKFLGFLGSDL